MFSDKATDFRAECFNVEQDRTDKEEEERCHQTWTDKEENRTTFYDMMATSQGIVNEGNNIDLEEIWD